MSEASVSNAKHPCRGIRKDGRPCRMMALPDSDRCFAHDPRQAEARQQARQKGGRNRSSAVRLRGLMPPRLAPIFDQLEAALTEVHDGTLDPKAATAMASLARALVAVLQVGEMEDRMRQIEAQLKDRGREWSA